MGTYWDNFIKEYSEYLTKFSLVIILEAFYYYSLDNKDACDSTFSIKKREIK